MRWGVRDEASNDHTTTELCMSELHACKTLSTGPYFVVCLKCMHQIKLIFTL